MIVGLIVIGVALIFFALVLHEAGYISLPWEKGKRG